MVINNVEFEFNIISNYFSNILYRQDSIGINKTYYLDFYDNSDLFGNPHFTLYYFVPKKLPILHEITTSIKFYFKDNSTQKIEITSLPIKTIGDFIKFCEFVKIPLIYNFDKPDFDYLTIKENMIISNNVLYIDNYPEIIFNHQNSQAKLYGKTLPYFVQKKLYNFFVENFESFGNKNINLLRDNLYTHHSDENYLDLIDELLFKIQNRLDIT